MPGGGARRSRSLPPPARESMADILEQGGADNRDKTYVKEWKLFTTWVDDNWLDEEIGVDIEMDPPPGDDFGGITYLTRNNLDAYYKYEVVHRIGNKNTISRIKSALIRYANYDESQRIAPDVAGDKFESMIMKQAVDAQQLKEAARNRKDAPLDDKCPHRFCKHTLSVGERLKVMKVAMDSVQWENSTVAINLGHNLALRGASIRAFTLCDLRLATGYGPDSNKANPDPRFERTLMLILRKGPFHKDRFKTTKQVGMWRHRKWLLDPNFAIALAVIYKLQREADNINFCLRPATAENESRRPAWWDIKLIAWKDYKGTMIATMIAAA
jgi:hypothetical protein